MLTIVVQGFCSGQYNNGIICKLKDINICNMCRLSAPRKITNNLKKLLK